MLSNLGLIINRGPSYISSQSSFQSHEICCSEKLNVEGVGNKRRDEKNKFDLAEIGLSSFVCLPWQTGVSQKYTAKIMS